jgi:acyl-[acyl-carrier-protein]-phospholipid O-acyltransferase/long-chain-fatty-acid--[acyl-carrier-protein] ligase
LALPDVNRKSQGAFRLLVSRRFGPLFATQFLSAFNDNALRNALVLMIAYRADAAGQISAQLMIPLAAGLFMLPFFLCSATAGQIADESDKSRLIRLIKLIEIPVMLAAAAGVLAGSATVLLVLLFVMGIVAAFFGPLKYAILPDLLAPEELLLGNALVEAGIAGMLIATRHGSAAVAGLIVAVALVPPGRPVDKYRPRHPRRPVARRAGTCSARRLG